MLPSLAFFWCYWSRAIAHERGGERKKEEGRREKREEKERRKKEKLYYFTLYIDIAL